MQSNLSSVSPAQRPLHLIWIVETSEATNCGRNIQILNTAVKELLPDLRDAAADNPQAEMLVRVLQFNDTASWRVAAPTNVEHFRWEDLKAAGTRVAMGHALRTVAEQLKIPPMSKRGLPPVLVLVSGGQPTDDFDGGLAALNGQPWRRHAVRIAVAVGDQADRNVLRRFAQSEHHVTDAHNAFTCASFVTQAIKNPFLLSDSISVYSETSSNLHIPSLLPSNVTSVDEVW